MAAHTWMAILYLAGAAIAGELYCKKDSDMLCKRRGENRCIPSSWRCDGRVDCDDERDELDCAEIKCGGNYLKCEVDGKERCLWYYKFWNGVEDCDNGTDEVCDPETHFKCHTYDSTWCYPNSKRCNGRVDCYDETDEEGCDEITCEASEFNCTRYGRQTCRDRGYLCDGHRTCDDGFDEMDCGVIDCTQVDGGRYPIKCMDDGFQKCIRTRHLCNGRPDCSDGTDEADCPEDDDDGTRKRLISLINRALNKDD